MKGTTTAAAGLAMLVGLSIGIGSAAAHHSGSMFDHSKLMTIKGTVTEFRWVNPHASVSVNGTVDGRGQPEPERESLGGSHSPSSRRYPCPRRV